MPHAKTAMTDHPILEQLAARWSPYAFDGRAVEQDKLLACLEAARWAASSYNEQPWHFLLATRDDMAEFSRLLSCLLEANQGWAANAGALLLTVVAKSFRRNGNPNRVAEHDLGLAVGNLSVQAVALGLQTHQMAGLNLSKARQTYGIPDGYEPVTAIAIGYPAQLDSADASPLAERDRAPRQRKPLRDFVFAGAWQKPHQDV